MKLLNPTDKELSHAFAEFVAGYRRDDILSGFVSQGIDKWGKHYSVAPNSTVPDFAYSADAVLPWLQQHYLEAKYWTGAAGERPCWRIGVEGEPTTRQSGQGDGQSFARAAVIALLRAHGVEIEFS